MMALFGEVIAGWLLADFLGGFFHWLEDRVLRESDSFVGRHIVAPNRLHHRRPLALFFGDLNLLERNWTTWLPTTALAAVLFALFGFSVFLLSTTVGGLVMYEVHRAAHRPSQLPQWVLVMQEIGVIQSPKHHAVHHRPPSEVRYCILTDWLNPLLDEIRFWHRLERLIGVA